MSRLILFSASLLLYVRLFVGIDFTDESYMVLNAIGPMIGARPFVDEMMISQMASLLITPFAFIYHLLTPAFTGVVLFFRHIYFAVGLLTAFVVYRSLKGKLANMDRALCAVLPLTFIPSCLPVPAYNSLIYFFALAGQMLFLTARPFGAGLFHSLAAFAHPAYLSAPCVTFVVSLWSRARGDSRKYLMGSILFFALIGVLIAVFGFETLKTSFSFSTLPQTFGGSSKLAMIWQEFIHYWRRPELVIIWAAACVIPGLAGRLNWAVAIGGFAVTQDFLIPADVSYGLHQRFICYALFSAFLILVDRKGWRDRENQIWLARLWLPSFVAGWSLAFVSSNGLLMAPLGWIGCLIYTFWRMLRHERPKNLSLKEWRWAVQTAAAFFILLQAQVFTLTHFYREDEVEKLDSQVKDGAFAGIFTTYQRRNFISDFTNNMNVLRVKNGDKGAKIFIYDMFAAGYLLSPFKPNGPAYMTILPQWVPQMRAPMVQHFQDPGHWPTYVVEFFYFSFGANNLVNVNPRDKDPFNDPFKDFFIKTGKFSSVFESEMYRILIRQP